GGYAVDNNGKGSFTSFRFLHLVFGINENVRDNLMGLFSSSTVRSPKRGPSLFLSNPPGGFITTGIEKSILTVFAFVMTAATRLKPSIRSTQIILSQQIPDE